MFEISILCVIGLAIGYWLTLWLLGRHDDVLHGDFVHTEPSQETQLPSTPLPPVVPAANADRLQSLLTAIKQDLRDAAQI
jgi:hypothetical protein